MIAPIESLGKTRRQPLSTRPLNREPAAGPPVELRPPVEMDASVATAINRSLGRYPTAAVVSAVVVGLTLGWLIKRKWNT